MKLESIFFGQLEIAAQSRQSEVMFRLALYYWDKAKLKWNASGNMTIVD